jgi:hypothetical protein
MTVLDRVTASINKKLSPLPVMKSSLLQEQISILDHITRFCSNKLEYNLRTQKRSVCPEFRNSKHYGDRTP